MSVAAKEELDWTDNIWGVIKDAVKDESQRVKISQKVIPVIPMEGAVNVPTDNIVVINNVLTVPQGTSDTFIETIYPFNLDFPPQVSTLMTAARWAANSLAIAQDQIVFRGLGAFQAGEVRINLRNQWNGLLNVDPDAGQPVVVAPIPAIAGQQQGPARYGRNTLIGVVHAIADLQQRGHFGPYALILPSVVYADTFVPEDNTSILYADRIKPLVEKGFFGTGALQPAEGILISLGGDTMDLPVSVDTSLEVLPKNADGQNVFRVVNKFTVRIKDERAVRRLQFD